jgi:cytochrome c556
LSNPSSFGRMARTRRGMTTPHAAMALVLALMFIVIAGATVRAQDQGVPPPKDTIFARKITMGAIDMNMDEIETMLAPEGKLNLSDAQEHAETISTMLLAFPHLFPPATNQWKAGAERDPATDTFASPDLWEKFADFYQRANDASKIAWSASRAKRADEFRPLIGQLRARCNACHALNMKTD